MPEDNEEDDLIEVGFHVGLCPEFEDEDLIQSMEYLSSNIKYILIIECEKGMSYPYNRLICDNKYLIEAFDFDEATVDLEIKKGKVKKFIKHIESAVSKSEFLFAFSRQTGKEDFKNVVTTGILVSSVALEGDKPGMASKMAMVCITTP